MSSAYFLLKCQIAETLQLLDLICSFEAAPLSINDLLWTERFSESFIKPMPLSEALYSLDLFLRAF